MLRLGPAACPTLYFIGVTTGGSAIMTIFPAWAETLGLGRVAIKGIDFPLEADASSYREAVAFIKTDPLSRGALVTTHKVNLFAACRDLFDRVGPLAALMREASCLSKHDAELVADAKDPITCGLAIDGFLRPGHFAESGAEVFCIGAGGSGVAIAWHLAQPARGTDTPGRIIVSDRNPSRLEEVARVHSESGSTCPLVRISAADRLANDAVLGELRPGSLVINATGLGKDAPGSPLTPAARFPEGGVVWELNYRGDLVFLEQARAQVVERGLTLVDGWSYFLHGWTRVIAEVFGVPIATSGPQFEQLSDVARAIARK
jgi:shikimate 5-dehydrogenase